MSDFVKNAVDSWFVDLAKGNPQVRLTDHSWPAIAEYIRSLQVQNAILWAENAAYKRCLKSKGGA